MRYQYIPIRMSTTKKTDNTNVGKDIEQLKPSYGGSVKWLNFENCDK